MESKLLVYSMLVLRIFVLAALAATVALVVTNNVEFTDATKWKFNDVIANRYVLSVAVIAADYNLVQLPFASYYALRHKRLTPNGRLPHIDFYGDKVISLLLASGVGVGFAVTCELKNILSSAFDIDTIKDEIRRPRNDDYFESGIIASAVFSVALVCMAAVSVISSILLNRSRKGIRSGEVFDFQGFALQVVDINTN